MAVVSLAVAAWTQFTKSKVETKTSQAQIMDLVTETAHETIEMLNNRVTMAETARLQAEQRANRKEAENVALEESRAGLVRDLNWHKEGVQTLIRQLNKAGMQPVWDPAQTKPLLNPAQVERMIADMLRQNGLVEKLDEMVG